MLRHVRLNAFQLNTLISTLQLKQVVRFRKKNAKNCVRLSRLSLSKKWISIALSSEWKCIEFMTCLLVINYIKICNFYSTIQYSTKNEQALFLSFRRELVRFIFYALNLLFKTRYTHKDFLVYRLFVKLSISKVGRFCLSSLWYWLTSFPLAVIQVLFSYWRVFPLVSNP